MKVSESMAFSNTAAVPHRASGKGYFSRLLQSIVGIGLGLSLIEKTLLAALLLMLGMSAVDALQGHNVGNEEAVKLAKIAAQQELMAQNPTKGSARQQ